MSEIKLIALDMDGTLLDDDHATVPARNVRALRAAAGRGALVAMASGRAWDLLREVDAQLGVVHYAILSNGASVLDTRTGAWLCRNCLPEAARKALFELLLRWDLPFEVYCEGKNFIQRDRADRTVTIVQSERFENTLRRFSQFPEDLEATLAGRPVEKINVFHVPPECRAEVLAQAKACGQFSIASSFGENMEFTAQGVNKGAALQALAAHLGLGPEQVMAFGDAGNDLEMLRWAGWSFAMDNATEEAKQAARFRTGSNHDGGVGMAVERYILNP